MQFLLADEPGETDTEKVIAIKLKTKELKQDLGLATNPNNYKYAHSDIRNKRKVSWNLWNERQYSGL